MQFLSYKINSILQKISQQTNFINSSSEVHFWDRVKTDGKSCQVLSVTLITLGLPAAGTISRSSDGVHQQVQTLLH